MNETNLFKSLIPKNDLNGERRERLTKFDENENVKMLDLLTNNKSDVFLFAFNADRRKLIELIRLLTYFKIDEKRITTLFDEISKNV